MRVVAWNIRSGGGRRVDAIARQLRRWRPDLVTLSEFRATPPSLQLALLLADQGLVHLRSTCDAAAHARERAPARLALASPSHLASARA